MEGIAMRVEADGQPWYCSRGVRWVGRPQIKRRLGLSCTAGEVEKLCSTLRQKYFTAEDSTSGNASDGQAEGRQVDR